MLRRNQTKQSNGSKDNTPKEKYILGKSECSYEVASYLTGKLDVDAVTRLFNNKAMCLAETEGRSLKVMFNTGDEIKFLGFITAGDASIELVEDDIPTILEEARKGITKAISVDELIDLF